jgi:hypothetical protein
MSTTDTTITDAPVEHPVLPMASAINQALDVAMGLDPKVFLLGEDIAEPSGGVYKVTKGLSTKYGTARVRKTAISEAAIMGARLRFRAVMMTSIAFVLGLVPLVSAEGAAMLSRRAVGTAVFGGMLAAAIIGIFIIPMLYVVFQTLRERIKRRIFGAKPAAEAPHA